MICITGSETSAAELANRLDAHPDAFHEVRLDALQDLDDAAFELLKRHASRLLVCLRAARQGGAYRGDECARLDLLRRAQNDGCRYVDLEADIPSLAGFDRSRVVLSWHDFEGVPDDLLTRMRAMAERDVAVVKFAATVHDAAQLTALHTAGVALDGQHVLIGMGPAGMLSRTHYRAFGSAWTYVAASSERATAPGQLDLAAASAMAIERAHQSPLYGLVGGDQVLGSPGPTTYNRLFRARGHDGCYLPIITKDLNAAMPLLITLGARGLSVTMPLKGEAYELAQPDSVARRTLAVNSLKLVNERWFGRNTDVPGVAEPLGAWLRKRGGTRASKALILGSGGAARAAVEACRQLGLGVTVSARKIERAAALCEAAVPWEERASGTADVLINATPLSDDASPWPDDAALPPIVFDLAMARRSRLLEKARSQGCTTIDALTMWLHQGAAQMSWLLDDVITVSDLKEQLP